MTTDGADQPDLDARLLAALENPPPYERFPAFEDFNVTDFDPGTLAQFVFLMEEARDQADEGRMRAAVVKATKWAAVDTGAIEGLYEVERGFTLSVAKEAAAWDNMHLQVGEEGGRAIRDALEAYEYVLDAATESRPITETWIRELHAVICASQDTYTVLTPVGRQQHPLKKAEYKEYENSPVNLENMTVHSYAPARDTAAEMNRLVEELASPAFLAAHPVVQAAYAHYAFICVHPFADGNGRVARALASAFLYRRPGVPLVIFADQKPGYIAALEAADRGAFDLFVGFVAERAVDVVRMVADDMRRPVRPSLQDRLADMRKTLLGRGGLTHPEVDAVGSRMYDEVILAFRKVLEANPLDDPLTARLTRSPGLPTLPGEFRHLPNAQSVQLTINSAPPGAATITVHFGVGAAKGDQVGPDFVVVGGLGGAVLTDAYIRELDPSASPALTYRLELMAEDMLWEAVDKAIRDGEAQLRNSGY